MDLDDILLKSIYNNESGNITRALLCRGEIYCKFLNEPEKEIKSLVKNTAKGQACRYSNALIWYGLAAFMH